MKKVASMLACIWGLSYLYWLIFEWEVWLGDWARGPFILTCFWLGNAVAAWIENRVK